MFYYNTTFFPDDAKMWCLLIAKILLTNKKKLSLIANCQSLQRKYCFIVKYKPFKEWWKHIENIMVHKHNSTEHQRLILHILMNYDIIYYIQINSTFQLPTNLPLQLKSLIQAYLCLIPRSHLYLWSVRYIFAFQFMTSSLWLWNKTLCLDNTSCKTSYSAYLFHPITLFKYF